jgi:tRNA threonylcarbamoyladenosine biosynthesis protein TsaE
LKKYLDYNIATIDAVAQNIVPLLSKNTILAIHGQVGAGKTTLTTAICKALKVLDPISSPTYAIINEYAGYINNTPIMIAHMDWYRLEDADALIDAGVMDYLQQNDCLCIVEWSERAPELLPGNCIHIYLEFVSDDFRKLIIK